MDKGGQKSGSFMDVRPPGAAPAPPTSKPVFTNNQPTQADPMMATSPVPLNIPAVAEPRTEQTPTLPASEQAPAVTEPLPMQAPTSESTPTPPGIDGLEMTHKFAHDEPMYGQFKKRGKGKKILIFLLVLIVLGGGAFAVWYFLNSKSKPAPVIQQTTTTKVTPKKTSTDTSKVTSIVTPEDYQVFSDADLGYSFAAPKDFGTIKKELTATQSDNGTVIYRSPGQLPGKDLTGQLMITQYPDATSEITTGEGQLIALKNGKWVLTAAAGTSKVGDAYKDAAGKEPTPLIADDLDVYVFSSVKEDSTIVQLVFVANKKLNVIELPVAITGTGTAQQTLLKNNLLGTLKQL
jgi:hypothetical protein